MTPRILKNIDIKREICIFVETLIKLERKFYCYTFFQKTREWESRLLIRQKS